MLRYYIQEVKENIVFLFNAKKIDGKVINTAVFGNEFPKNLLLYKIDFLSRMKEKKMNLMKIRQEIYEKEDNFLHRDVLEIEIDFQIEVINFLVYTYDIEAQKIDPNYEIVDNIDSIDYDHFNQVFWGLTKDYLKKDFKLSNIKTYNIYFTKNELIYLLESARLLIPNIRYHFGEYPNLSFNGGLLKINNSGKYHVKDAISLIFHELTHFFRYENTKRNLGYFYSFSDYPTLEEGIAIYNEFIYGNRLIDYGGKDPIYDICFQYFMKDISEEEKKIKISKILRIKGFNKNKIHDYYDRFYRFSQIGSKNLYLKDLIYTKGYENVLNLIEEDSDNYERILAGRVGITTIRKGIIKPDNNLDSRAFFDEMEISFRKLLEVKEKQMN